MMKLTPAHVRTALLHAQGLTGTANATATKADVLRTIRRLHVLQIDTISVVNRSPYLVLYSRIGAFQSAWLTDLLADRYLFEYWSHAACFLPVEDFKYYRPFMNERRAELFKDGVWTGRWVEHEPVEKMLAHIRENGQVKSADFERSDGKKGTWWDWKAEKLALEHLFSMGDVMVARRDGFQRVYDLQERLHPWDEQHTPTADESYAVWTAQTAQALGVLPAKWFADYFRIKKADALTAIKALLQDGTLIEVEVQGETVPYYAHKSSRKTLKAIADGAIVPSRTVLLSPFDPVVWDRDRLLKMFGMDYKIEVYTPEPKRKYGYFTLPILHNDRIIGRLDPKAHRAQKRFEVKSIHLEPGVEIDDALVHGLAQAIRDFADWHGTPEISIGRTAPDALGAALLATGIL